MPSRAIARGSRRRHLVALGIGAFIASMPVWAPMLSATPATAHSSLIETSPAEGERLDSPPSEVSLQFSEQLIELGAIVRVVDAAGVDHTDGEPVIDGSTVTAAVDTEMPAGPSEIRWRVVSADGHPISGLVPFTVAGAEEVAAPTTAAPDATNAESGAIAEPEVTAEAEAAPTQEFSSAARILLVAAAGAVLALAVLLVVRAARRRSKAPQQ